MPVRWNIVEIEDKLQARIKELEAENKKLKSDLAFERTMLDNVKAECESLLNVVKKLNEYNRRLKQANDDLKEQNKKLREENKRLSDFLECEA